MTSPNNQLRSLNQHTPVAFTMPPSYVCGGCCGNTSCRLPAQSRPCLVQLHIRRAKSKPYCARCCQSFRYRSVFIRHFGNQHGDQTEQSVAEERGQAQRAADNAVHAWNEANRRTSTAASRSRTSIAHASAPRQSLRQMQPIVANWTLVIGREAQGSIGQEESSNTVPFTAGSLSDYTAHDTHAVSQNHDGTSTLQDIRYPFEDPVVSIRGNDYQTSLWWETATRQ